VTHCGDGGNLATSYLWREEVRPEDVEVVWKLVTATGFFSDQERDVAVELVEEYLRRGPASGYRFLFAELDGRPVGYVCYGPIPCTVGSFDLYWIVVDPRQQRRGLGRRLLEHAEQRIKRAGGRHVYVETSGRAQYAPTRAFYERCGYSVAAALADFYYPGDPKIVYRKVLSQGVSCSDVAALPEHPGTATRGL